MILIITIIDYKLGRKWKFDKSKSTIAFTKGMMFPVAILSGTKPSYLVLFPT
jgi:hypothetical protein